MELVSPASHVVRVPDVRKTRFTVGEFCERDYVTMLYEYGPANNYTRFADPEDLRRARWLRDLGMTVEGHNYQCGNESAAALYVPPAAVRAR